VQDDPFVDIFAGSTVFADVNGDTDLDVLIGGFGNGPTTSLFINDNVVKINT